MELDRIEDAIAAIAAIILIYNLVTGRRGTA